MGKEISKILPGLYVGRLDNAQNDIDMMACCITHVLSVHEPVKQKLQKFNSFTYFDVNVKDEDSACISKYFPKTNDFIHEARTKSGNVLIHCLAGVSRAPTIVLAYLMTVYNLKFQDAYNCLKSVRPNIKPNAGFIRQLADFEMKELIQERERLIDKFGQWNNYEEDKKLINELIDQFKQRERTDYYIDSSVESSYSDCKSNSLIDSYERPFKTTDENDEYCEDLSCDLPDPLAPRNDLRYMIPYTSTTSSTPSSVPGCLSEGEEEAEVPGSIAINNGIEERSNSYGGNSTQDYRGRAHSRTIDVDDGPSLERFGQTAPPSLPMFFSDTLQ